MLIKNYQKILIIILILIVYFFFYNIIFNYQSNQIKILPNDLIQIKINKNLEIKEDYLKFETKIKQVNFEILVLEQNIEENLKYGDSIFLQVIDIKKIKNNYHNKNSFNLVRYKKSHKINKTIFGKIQSIENTKPNLFQKIRNKREEYLQQIKKKYPQNHMIINSLIFGSKIEEEQIKEKITNLGIIQLFVISGMHINILINILTNICIFLKIRKKDLIISVILIFYYYLAGEGVSIQRAIIMQLMIVIFNYQKIKALKNTLYLTFLLNPNNIFNIGYILSYGISFYLELNKRIYQKENKKIQEKIYENYLTYTFTLPLIINLNNKISLGLPIVLEVYNKLILGYIYTSIVAILFLNFKLINYLLNIIFLNLNQIFYLINYFSLIGVVTVKKMNILLIFLYYYYYYGQMKEYYFYRTKIINKFYSIILIILILITTSNINFFQKVNIIDVGQGDSILIQKTFSNILIDTGDQKAKKEIINYLDQKGIIKLNYLIITHNHQDHNGNLVDILDKYKVNNLILNANYYIDNELKEKINKKSINLIKVKNLVKTKIGYFYTSSLFSDNENNNSIIYQTNLKKQKWLFMGDAEKELEEEILNKYDLNIDYLKLGHHGSKTSTTEELLLETTPKEVYISSGKENKYNHPSKETINKLEKFEIPYKDTQTEGEIVIRF